MKNSKLILIALGIIILAAVFRKASNPAVQKNLNLTLTQTPLSGATASLTGAPTPSSEDKTPLSGATASLSGAQTVAQITLTVTDPKNQAVVSFSPIVVKGKTIANAQVFVNDAETKADSSGYFSVTLPIDEGENEIIVVANNDNGEYAEQSMVVTLETPE